jgi:transcription antitermination factor NusG
MQGRSLYDEPEFQKLALEYAERTMPPMPSTAVIDDVVRGHWYGLELVGGREVRGVEEVANRVRLGTYLPMRRTRVSGRRGWRIVRRPLFAGYGSVLAKKITNYWDAIRACPDVRGIMTITHEGERIPAIIALDMIRFIQSKENGNDHVLAGDLQAQQDRLTQDWRKATRLKRHRSRAPERPEHEPLIEIEPLTRISPQR